jgi:CubicO group peptidase (beta-lactamase class C family)
MATFAENHTEFALGLSQDTTPGSEWIYHNGGVQVLEAVFRGATGMTIEAYAREHLWSRIGMSATWAHDRAGNPTTYANVMATCRDHAKFGYLWLRRGTWAGGEQVVPDSWVSQAITPSQDYNRAYGFLFWLNGQTPAMNAMNQPKDEMIAPWAPNDFFAARGFGNQFIDVIPSLDLVVVRFGPDPRSSFDFGSFNDDAEFGVHDQIVMPIVAGIED